MVLRFWVHLTAGYNSKGWEREEAVYFPAENSLGGDCRKMARIWKKDLQTDGELKKEIRET